MTAIKIKCIHFKFYLLICVALTFIIKLSAVAGQILFSDDFSADTTGGYTITDTWTESGTGQFLYDNAGERVQVLTGDNIGLQFSHSVPLQTSGSFSLDFFPTALYPYGGIIQLRLVEDVNNYYLLKNTDGYGPGDFWKVVGGIQADGDYFINNYSTGTNYHIEVHFSPDRTEVHAFGETLVIDTDTSSISVNTFEVETQQHDAYFDNILYSEHFPPTLIVSDPDGTGDELIVGGLYSIVYSLDDMDDIVNAAFYYDTDLAGLDGTAIAGTCAAAPEGTDAVCVWNTDGMAPGSYYIYGIADDGKGQVSAYSTAPVRILPVDALSVASVTRISHPAYKAVNLFYGVRDYGIWNRDNSRIMIYESLNYTHPSYGTTGRGFVWSYVSDLRNWTESDNSEDYEAVMKPVPNVGNATTDESVYWSPFEGEENIIYTTIETGYVVKINVDTGSVTNVIDVGAVQGTRCYGWTNDNYHLICSMKDEDWSDGGYEIDVQTPEKTYVNSLPPNCSAEWRRWPDATGHGHSGKSPGGTKYASHYGQANDDGVRDLTVCSFEEDLTVEYQESPPYPWAGVHVSWKASENWFLSNSGSPLTVSQWPSIPTLEEYKLYQVFFNGTDFLYHELLGQQTTVGWDDCSQYYSNYHSHFIATLRKDGRQALFTSTDGRYSYEDYVFKGVTPWGYEGFFIADFIPYSGEAGTSGMMVFPDSESVNARAEHNIGFTAASNMYILTVDKVGAGNGTVSSTPPGIDCGELEKCTNCTETFNEGTIVTLTQEAGVNSVFTGWTGAGCGTSEECVLTMNNDVEVTAHFESCSDRRVRIAGESAEYFTALQDAYDSAVQGDSIQVQNTLLTDDLIANRNISITITGGYSCDFSAVTGNTEIAGTLTISDGMISLEHLVVQ